MTAATAAVASLAGAAAAETMPPSETALPAFKEGLGAQVPEDNEGVDPPSDVESPKWEEAASSPMAAVDLPSAATAIAATAALALDSAAAPNTAEIFAPASGPALPSSALPEVQPTELRTAVPPSATDAARATVVAKNASGAAATAAPAAAAAATAALAPSLAPASSPAPPPLPCSPPPSVRTTLCRSWREFVTPQAKRRLALACVTLVASSSANLAVPRLLGVSLDSHAGHEVDVRRKVLLALAVYGVGGVASWLRVFAFRTASAKIEARIQERVFERGMAQPLHALHAGEPGGGPGGEAGGGAGAGSAGGRSVATAAHAGLKGKDGAGGSGGRGAGGDKSRAGGTCGAAGAGAGAPLSLIEAALRNDAPAVADCITQTLGDFLRGCNSAFGGSVMLYLLSPRLTLLTLTLVPFVGSTAMYWRTRGAHLDREYRAGLADAAGFAQARLAAAETVKALAAEPAARAAFGEQLAAAYGAGRRAARSEGCLMGGLSLMMNCCLMGVLCVGGTLVRKGQLSPGRLASFALYSGMVGLGFASLFRSYSEAVKGAAAAETILRVLDAPVEEEEAEAAGKRESGEDKPKFMGSKAAAGTASGDSATRDSAAGGGAAIPPPSSIRFVDVSFDYNKQSSNKLCSSEERAASKERAAPAAASGSRDAKFHSPRAGSCCLRGVSFQARRGEIVALTGLSGAGKTTIARLLVRLLEPAVGAIFFGERPLAEIPRGALRRRLVTYVDQGSALFEGTVRENVAIARPDACDAEILAALANAAALNFVRAMPGGLAAPVGARGCALSGGQRQRIALARAFLRDPPVLILDESTSSLDVHTEMEIQTALRRTRGDKITVLLAHRPSTLAFADRVIVLDQGRIVEEGPYDALLRSPPPPGAEARVAGGVLQRIVTRFHQQHG